MTRTPIPALILLLTAIATSAPGQQSTKPVAADSDAAKLERFMGFLRDRNARDYAIAGPNAVDEGRFVTIGGIEQWITIRGEDRRNPVILLLHGGPGDATNPWSYAGLRSWLTRFTLVQWDQRGSGKTLGRNGPGIGPSITIDQLTKDGIELAESLRKSLGKDKLVLVGHSWGSVLGSLMAQARPDLFFALVGTGQVADERQNYPVAYRELLAKADAIGNRTAAAELRAVGPPPWSNGRGFGVERKWANRIEGADLFLGTMLGLAIAAPGYTARDINDWGDGQLLSGERLFKPLADLEPGALGTEFKLPVFVIQGAEDFTTPTSLAREFVARIRAPKKEFVTIEGGHFAAFMHPVAFERELARRVLPLTVPASR